MRTGPAARIAASSRAYAPMLQAHLEELGMLKVLERIEAGSVQLELPVRVALIQRGLIDPASAPALTEQGRELLLQLRMRDAELRDL